MFAAFRPLVFAVVASLAALPSTVRAQDHDHDHYGDRDHDLARELYEHGKIRSLADVLRAVHEHTPGDVVGIALVPSGTDWVYRIQVVGADGRRIIVDVDAETAVPIEPDENQ